MQDYSEDFRNMWGAGLDVLFLIVGLYEPEYIYGNVKFHKPSNPLQPIISYIPTPTYQLAKSLNKLIT